MLSPRYSNLLVVASVVAIALLVSFAPSWLRRSLPCSKEGGSWYRTACAVPPTPPPPPKVCEPAWSCGTLGRGEAGMKKDVWYLKYQDVTGPAMLEIVFEDGAQCSVDDAIVDCSMMNPVSGSGSSFRGSKDGETFRVSRMEFTTRK